MNPTWITIELRRVLRNRVGIFFTTVLPAVLYLIFGTTQGTGDARLAHGDVTMYVLVSMAAYGAVTATATHGAAAAVERSAGWGRQVALTPLPERSYVLTKLVVAGAVALLPVTLLYALGAVTGAEGTARAWGLSAAVVALGSVVLTLYGLVLGLLLRTDAALSATSGSLVVLAFLGNVFTPLSGTLLDIARLSPVYGYVSLARRPVTGGVLAGAPASAPPQVEPLWVALANVGVWTTLLAVLALFLVQRGRRRG